MDIEVLNVPKSNPTKGQNMRTRFDMNRILAGALALGILTTQTAFGQSPLQFTGAEATPENAIQLFWASHSNEVYEIDYADALGTNADGSTTWNKLYDDYPSHGTNTFIGDFGNYFLTPSVPHPKYRPARFYRVVDKGTNSGESPFVTITPITNGATLSDQVTVSVVVTSSLPIITTELYVDGQRMDSSDDGSNYVINTCEWLNGSHVLFATAEAQSRLSGPSGSWAVDIGRGVSPYVTVNFSNLISGVAFSQPFFEPSLGQTQEVTAVFAANCDWTLQVLDESSNVVRAAAGSGTSLLFDWDGAGDGGADIPDGVYYYLISTQTNGLPFQSQIRGGTGSGSGSPPSPFMASAASDETSDSGAWWAMPADGSGAAVPLALYPPGVDTNNFLIFEASSSEMRPRRLSSPVMANDSSGSNSSYNGPSAQTTVAPTRPPIAPVKGAVGTVGVAYYNFPVQKSYPVPNSGLPYPLNKIQIEGSTGNVTFTNIPECPKTADNFVSKMIKKGWQVGFNFDGNLFRVNDLRAASLGGKGMFGNVNLGLFMDHGSYGTSLDYHSWASQTYQTYFPSDNPADASNPWIALSEFGLGGNLRWMAILACNSLRDQNYNSMANAGVLPIKSNLHLLCGTTTVSYMSNDIGTLWAAKMLGSLLHSPQTIEQAWYGAGHDAYHNATNIPSGSTVVFRVAGFENCFNDTLQRYAGSTSGDIISHTQPVYP